MVPEQVQFDRGAIGQVQSIVIGTTATLLCPNDPMRTGLVVSSPLANRLTLSDSPSVTPENGINLGAGMSPLYLNLKDHGALVQKAIYGVMSVAAATIGFYPNSNEECVVPSHVVPGGMPSGGVVKPTLNYK